MSYVFESLLPSQDRTDGTSDEEEVFEEVDSGASPELTGKRRSARKRKIVGSYFPEKRTYKKSRCSTNMGVGHSPSKNDGRKAPGGGTEEPEPTQSSGSGQAEGSGPKGGATGGYTLDTIGGMIAGLL